MRDLKEIGRVSGTEMRFWMRSVERHATRAQVRRPQDDVPDTPPTDTVAPLIAAAEPAPTAARTVGNWTLSEDPASGALVASYLDGTTVILATPNNNGES
jgi:hypothetical protein